MWSHSQLFSCCYLRREVLGPISHYSSPPVVIEEGGPGAHIPLQLSPCCYWGGRSSGPYPTTTLLLLLFRREVLGPISHYSSSPVVIEEGGPGAHIPLQLFPCCYWGGWSWGPYPTTALPLLLLRREVLGPISHYSPSPVVIEEGGPGAHIPPQLFPCCYWGGWSTGPYPTTALTLLLLRREVLGPISHYSSSPVVIEEGGPGAHIPLQLFPCCYWGGWSTGPYPTTALLLLLLRREVLGPISHYSSSPVVIEEGGPGAHIPLQPLPCCYWGGWSRGPYPTTALLLLLLRRVVHGPISHYSSSPVVIEEGGPGAHIPLQLLPCCYWGGRSWGPYPTTALLLLLLRREVLGPISHHNSSLVVIEEGGPRAHIPLQPLPCCYWGGRSWGPYPTTALLLLLLRRVVLRPISHYSSSPVVIEEGGPGAHIPLQLLPCCYWGGRSWGPYPTTALLLLLLRREVLGPISHYSSYPVVIEEGGPGAHIPLQLLPCCYWGGRSWGPYPTTALLLLLLRREVLGPISHYSSSPVVIEEGGPGAHIPLQLLPCCYWGGRSWGPYPTTTLTLLLLRRVVLGPISHYSSYLVVIEEGGPGAHIPLQLFSCCYWGGWSTGPYPTTALLLLLLRREVLGPISHYSSSPVVIEERGPGAHIPLQPLPCCYWGGWSTGPYPTTALLLLLLRREVLGPISHYSSSPVVNEEGGSGAHIPLQLFPCCYWGGWSRGPYPTTALPLLLFWREVLGPISHYNSYPVVIEEGGPRAHIPLQLFSCC